MTAAPSMTEVLAGALRAQGLTDEPEKFDSDIHGWRCSHPDIYGRCDCFAETVRDLAQALAAAGFGHVASVERERDDLARWKREALPVLDGLQELGKALGLPLGERITGERALEAVQALVAQVAAVRVEAYSEDAQVVLFGVTGTHPESYGGVTKDEALECAGASLTRIRAALDGEGGR